MARIITDLKNRFLAENIVGRLIYINVAVFLLFPLLDVFTLFNIPSPALYLKMWLELPSAPSDYIQQPWSLVTYMFLHGGIMHILWNMLALYWFGKIFLSFFSTRHFVGLYLLGGIVGGIFFMLAYNVFPMFTSSGDKAYLVGASAAVLAIAIASAVRVPDYKINMLFIGEVKLSTLAVATVIISLLLVTSNNAGGSFAHLGGAFAGWAFAYYLNKGRDLTLYINKAVDFVADICKKDFKRARKPKMNIFNAKRSGDYDYNAQKKEQNAEVDKILEKLKKSGYSSLTEEEKKKLFDASK
jgi:membrane associated rhomboid family serine protease